MNATINKPRAAGKRKAQRPAGSEDLVKLAAKVALTLASTTADSDLHDHPRDHVDKAVCLLGRIADPDNWERVQGVDDADTSAMLHAAARAVELELRDIDSQAGQNLLAAVHDAVLLRQCLDYLVDLIHAVDGGPDQVVDLVRLVSFSGIIRPLEVAAVIEPAKSKGPKELQLFALSQLLYNASRVDGFYRTGYSLRLLRVASELALDVAGGADARPPRELISQAFDLAALVSASLRVPGDEEKPQELLALIEKARGLLNDLTDSNDCFESHLAAPPAPSSPRYTAAQMKDVLGHMACICQTATELMMDVQAHIGGSEWTTSQCVTTLHAAAQTVRMAGAMADQASGARWVGGPIEWSMGGAPS